MNNTVLGRKEIGSTFEDELALVLDFSDLELQVGGKGNVRLVGRELTANEFAQALQALADHDSTAIRSDEAAFNLVMDTVLEDVVWDALNPNEKTEATRAFLKQVYGVR